MQIFVNLMKGMIFKIFNHELWSIIQMGLFMICSQYFSHFSMLSFSYQMACGLIEAILYSFTFELRASFVFETLEATAVTYDG